MKNPPMTSDPEGRMFFIDWEKTDKDHQAESFNIDTKPNKNETRNSYYLLEILEQLRRIREDIADLRKQLLIEDKAMNKIFDAASEHPDFDEILEEIINNV